ncbi:ketopantoate reductase family protein [Alkalihalobacillus sp. BA299]|uniref:ketopantoate reductase family protein n=1 Tax=Alkalihalobacillus sp. BA299 TaxID=2815938 RepID=UPI001ADAF1F4|nr:2-dehydropantoate 2-reductase N-terminal domain-containing protein [Alkalihalobacillus sp. BA299]
MNITIFGAGAIGGVIGAYLVKGGQQVTFVDIAEDHVKEMRSNGLKINMQEDPFTVAVDAYTVDELIEKGEPLDVVFLCVKAQYTKAAVQSFMHLLSPQSMVVSFQNGLCESVIASLIGKERTVGCFVNLFADYMKPGEINYGGIGSVYIGEIDRSISKRVENLVEILSLWGNAKSTDNINGYLWGKIAYGTILTATALTNETIADLLDLPRHRLLFCDLAAEVLAVAESKGISPEGFDDWCPELVFPIENRNHNYIDDQFNKLVSRLRTYTKTKTGIWRDLAVRKRKTEVPDHLTPVIEEGELAGLNMELTKATLKMIVEIEDGKREMSIENLEVLHRIHTNKSQLSMNLKSGQ